MRVNREKLNLTSPTALILDAAVITGYLAWRKKNKARTADTRPDENPRPSVPIAGEAEELGEGVQVYVNSNDGTNFEMGVYPPEEKPIAVAVTVEGEEGQESLEVHEAAGLDTPLGVETLFKGMSILRKRKD